MSTYSYLWRRTKHIQARRYCLTCSILYMTPMLIFIVYWTNIFPESSNMIASSLQWLLLKEINACYHSIFPLYLSFHLTMLKFDCLYAAKSFTFAFAPKSSSLLYFFIKANSGLGAIPVSPRPAPYHKSSAELSCTPVTEGGQEQASSNRVSPCWEPASLTACQKPNLANFTALWKAALSTQPAEGTLFDFCFPLFFVLVNSMPKAIQGFIKARLLN